MNRVRIKFYGFPPDEFLDILLCACWLLEIKTERSRAYRLLIDVMKRCQVRVAECLINCKHPEKFSSPMQIFIQKDSYRHKLQHNKNFDK